MVCKNCPKLFFYPKCCKYFGHLNPGCYGPKLSAAPSETVIVFSLFTDLPANSLPGFGREQYYSLFYLFIEWFGVAGTLKVCHQFLEFVKCLLLLWPEYQVSNTYFFWMKKNL